MTVDISRVTFAPRKNYAWPIEQQGRVALDSDGTEAGAIQDRRSRSETYDVAGRVAVPVGVPDSFLIDVVGGNVVIHPGRLYVDGLQAENHGNAPFAFDPILAELRGSGPVPFDQQPYRPGFVPGIPAPGLHVLYLDVWHRVVTPLEDPALIEPAIGVDTTGRVQTVWQVRDLANVGDVDCATPDGELPGWNAITAPSAGRLSSRAHIGPPQTDPCLLPPGSGYTGLENRTYRVEIHDESPAGTFRFKWAMYNATVASAILSQPAADTLHVVRTAKDDVMRFNPGDWVEITDDRSELEGVAGLMRQILSVDDDAATITLTTALPAGALLLSGGGPDLDQTVHPRVRKWDQGGVVRDSNGTMLIDLNALGSAGVIAVPAFGTWVTLNDGVEVSFGIDPAGGRFRVGDYWVFTARTIGREVQALVQAPPLGIHHHYCRLAVVDAGPGGWIAPIVEDCRPKPPVDGDSAGCCTIIVHPGESIQNAIDALPKAGGCVCLKSGRHPVRAPIRIQRDNVSLHGESMGAIVEGRDTGLLIVNGGGLSGVRLHSITFAQIGDKLPLITVQGAAGVQIVDCRLQVDGGSASVGVFARAANDLLVSDCVFQNLSVGVWIEERSGRTTIADCDFTMGKSSDNTPSTVAILMRSSNGALIAERNRIRQAVSGIVVDDDPSKVPFSLSVGSRIAGNEISLVGGATDGTAAWGIDVAAAQSMVTNNRVLYAGGRVVGIRVAGDASLVEGNVVTAKASALAMGIVAGFAQASGAKPVDRVTVANNTVQGVQNGIAIIGVTRATVADNHLGEGSEGPAIGIALIDAVLAHVTGNIIAGPKFGVLVSGGERARIAGNSFERSDVGILVGNTIGPAIVGNRLTGLSSFAIVIVNIRQRCEVIENRLANCGHGDKTAIGIGVALVWGELHIEANEIMDTGLSSIAGDPGAATAYGISGDLILEARIQGNLVTYSDISMRKPEMEDRALRMRGLLELTQNFGNASQTFGFGVQIADNKFIGVGATALVELLSQAITDNVIVRFERVQFSGNYCSHASLPVGDNAEKIEAATVSLVGRLCTVSGNQVKASAPKFWSYHFHGMPGPFVGNVSHGPNRGRAAAAQFPAPEAAFNMIA